jgi:uncharacterized protein YdhG (YjbR/CyaY superfamily)
MATATASTFSDTEREAMKARAKELAAEAKAGKNRAEGEKAVQKAIAGLSGTDKTIATALHTLITKTAPSLFPKTWYGFPAYANAEGKVICFFQYAGKFKARYATLGFNDGAMLDDGEMWPVAFALKKITPVEEKQIIALVKKAVK